MRKPAWADQKYEAPFYMWSRAMNRAGRFMVATGAACLLLAITHGATSAQSRVAHSAESVNRAPVWQLGPRLLSIGAADGAAAYVLRQPASAQVISGNRIAFLNARTELRIYDDQGHWQATYGGRGSGPGEFAQAMSLHHVRGDSLAIVDVGMDRISVHAPDGQYVRSYSFPISPGGEAWVLEDMALVFIQSHFLGFGAAAQLHEYPVPLLLLRDGATRADTLALLSAQLYGSRSSFSPVVFGAQPHFAAGPGRIYAGSSGQYAIHVFDRLGKPVRTVTTTLPPVPVTDAHLRARLDARSDRARGRGGVAAGTSSVPHAAAFPEYSGFLADGAGRLWVRRFAPPGATEVDWHVYDARGAIAGRLSMPVAFQPTQVGEDYVLGVFTDELGVQYVRSHRLLR
jgi:hypothetical protein